MSGLPKPVQVFTDIKSPSIILSIDRQLRGKSGIYSFICSIDGKQYIGSAKDLGKRMRSHIAGRNSNIHLQRAITLHGIENFTFLVYEFSPYVLPAILELETYYLSLVPAHLLYNIRLSGTSMLGFKHSPESVLKQIARFANPINHPMYGKNHTPEAKLLISKPGALNPMYGKKHTPETIAAISAAKSRSVYIYTPDNIFVQEFASAKLASVYFGVYRGTIGRYVASGKLFQGKYFIRNTRS